MQNQISFSNSKLQKLIQQEGSPEVTNMHPVEIAQKMWQQPGTILQQVQIMENNINENSNNNSKR